ncbi:MAG: gamma-glutamyltransferase family protein [Pseudomonadales bacterium]
MTLNWDCPYPSNRSPVFARNMVATSQPLAVQAGINAMRAGGNAVDAAIATAITLTVVEPNNNGIGSDAFAIVWDGSKLHGLNASGRSPAALDAERFSGRDKMPALGWDAVTVPGAVSAWVELSQRFGKLPFDELFADAIHHANSGFQPGPKTGFFWQLAEQRYKAFKPFMDTFMIDGRAPRIGELIRLPDHANSLQDIASTRGDSFYRGALAQAMVEDSDLNDGTLTLEDLAGHQCDWVGTINATIADYDLHEIPPNGQGLMALIALGILNKFDVSQYALDSVDSIHLQIESTRIAYAYIERHLADIEHMRVKPAELLADNFLSARASEIKMDSANVAPSVLGASPDTVYLTTADASGMMVSMIQSNYRGFGSGIVVPGTGVSMQNRGSGFVLEDGHPNQVGGSKRPYQTIIPGFAMRGNEPLLSFGVMGGHMQAQGHLQMMIRIFIHQQNPQAASDAPRWHLLEDGRLALEDGFDDGVAEELGRRGHNIVRDNPEHLFGGAQLIYRMKDGYCAGSDHRKEGHAAGF